MHILNLASRIVATNCLPKKQACSRGGGYFVRKQTNNSMTGVACEMFSWTSIWRVHKACHKVPDGVGGLSEECHVQHAFAGWFMKASEAGMPVMASLVRQHATPPVQTLLMMIGEHL